jgi:hypothetical protein
VLLVDETRGTPGTAIGRTDISELIEHVRVVADFADGGVPLEIFK